MPDEYVGFVSDDFFLECIKEVCEHYSQESQKTMKELQTNGLDSFKMVFDIMNSNSTVEGWIGGETIRQLDKTISNWIGDFHQKLLGGVDGWEDLGKGHETKVDLKKDDDTVFVELKNKHNTTKGSDMIHYYDNLKRIVDEYPSSVGYFAFITPKSENAGNETWKIKGRDPNERVRKLWGTEVYSLITGDKDALLKTWSALPSGISAVINSDYSFSEADAKKMSEIFSYALTRG